MTKEPSKDFRQAVRETLELFMEWRTDKDGEIKLQELTLNEATTHILALCKEMLVPRESEAIRPNAIGWNACRSELLKQLGEK